MKKTILYIYVIIFPFIGFGQNKFIQLENLFNELKTQNNFNGNVLIAEKGNPIFTKSYGIENEMDSIMLSSQSIFCLASITKQFTAASIILLKNRGQLKFSDKLSKYLPKLTYYKDVTIHNLLTHTSGLPDYMKFMDTLWDKKLIATNQDVIKILSKYKPKTHFKPNEKWEYSNTGYMLLASIVEKISKQSFNNFLKENIFNLLKMNNTFIYSRRLNPKRVTNLTIGYSNYSDSLKRRITPDDFGSEFFITYLDGLYGAGRLFSTAEDLLKWDRALYSEKIFSNSDKEKMFYNYETNKGKKIDYGYGWKIEDNPEFGRIIFHGGRWGGYITYFERHLDNNKTIIILQNIETDKTLIPVERIRQIIYNKVKEIPLETLKRYAGKYITENGVSKEVLLINNKLYIPMNPSVKLELIPISKNKFIVDGFSPEVSYTFILDKNGEVEKYRVQQIEQEIDKVLMKIK